VGFEFIEDNKIIKKHLSNYAMGFGI